MILTLLLQVVTTAAASAFAIISARLLGPHDRGLVVIALVGIQMAAQFGTLGQNQAARAQATREGAAQALGSLSRHRTAMVSATLVLGLFFSMGSVRPWRRGGEDWSVVGLMVLIGILTMMTIVLRDLTHGAGRHRHAQACDLLMWLVALAGLAGLWAAGWLSAPTATMALGLGYVAQLAALLRGQPKIEGGEITHLSVARFLGNSGQYALMRVDKFMVGAVLGAVTTGLYSVASTIAELSWVACLLLAQYAAKAATSGSAKGLVKIRGLVVGGCVLWCLIGGLFGGRIVQLLFGEAFTGANELLLPRLVSAAACGVMFVELNVLMARDANKDASALAWLGVACAAGLIAFAPTVGLVPAMWGMAVVFVILAGVASWRGRPRRSGGSVSVPE